MSRGPEEYSYVDRGMCEVIADAVRFADTMDKGAEIVYEFGLAVEEGRLRDWFWDAGMALTFEELTR